MSAQPWYTAHYSFIKCIFKEKESYRNYHDMSYQPYKHCSYGPSFVLNWTWQLQPATDWMYYWTEDRICAKRDDAFTCWCTWTVTRLKKREQIKKVSEWHPWPELNKNFPTCKVIFHFNLWGAVKIELIIILNDNNLKTGVVMRTSGTKNKETENKIMTTDHLVVFLCEW